MFYPNFFNKNTYYEGEITKITQEKMHIAKIWGVVITAKKEDIFNKLILKRVLIHWVNTWLTRIYFTNYIHHVLCLNVIYICIQYRTLYYTFTSTLRCHSWTGIDNAISYTSS